MPIFRRAHADRWGLDPQPQRPAAGRARASSSLRSWWGKSPQPGALLTGDKIFSEKVKKNIFFALQGSAWQATLVNELTTCCGGHE
jgi:hypothetical protein